MQNYWTIPGFTALSLQDLFDMSARHLLSTKTKSINDYKTCIYSGSGCGAAPFLQEQYREKADGGVGITWGMLSASDRVPKHHASFVASLQRCHDSATIDDFLISWKDRMIDLATTHGLSIAVLEEKTS